MITKRYVVRWPTGGKSDGIILLVCGENKWLISGVTSFNGKAKAEEDTAYLFQQKFRYNLAKIDSLTPEKCYKILKKGGEIV